MKIKKMMMKKLCLPTWDEVEQTHPMTSSYKALEEFFIIFREWVCVFRILIDLFIVLFSYKLSNYRNHLDQRNS